MSESVLRVDKWLWHARFFKSRTLASRLCESGRLRVNGAVVRKSHQVLRPRDVLTFPKGADIRVVRVVALGSRRGPAMEARGLYDDLQPPPQPSGPLPASMETPPVPIEPLPTGKREPGAGRPTKAERRALDQLRKAPNST